jgi:hypothetical protein
VLSVRYKLDFCILFRGNSVFKGLTLFLSVFGVAFHRVVNYAGLK